MQKLFVKNNLQFRTEMKAGMIFRRVWFHKTGDGMLDRRVLKVQTNGFWLEDLDRTNYDAQGVWCEWGTAKDWKFVNGKIYMIFNHEQDYKEKEKKLTPPNFKKYQERYKKYIDETLPVGLVVDGFKVLAIYELWSIEKPQE